MRFSPALREKVEIRAKNLCEYCLCPQDYSPQSFSLEHTFPKSKGGSENLENLALACQTCNNFKYNKVEAIDPFSQQTVPLYNPRKDNWKEHFVWNADFTEIIGISPTGRATVKALKINRESVCNLRSALCAVGKHPPK